MFQSKVTLLLAACLLATSAESYKRYADYDYYGEDPTAQPTTEPPDEPPVEPTDEPTVEPTIEPTSRPPKRPSKKPSGEEAYEVCGSNGKTYASMEELCRQTGNGKTGIYKKHDGPCLPGEQGWEHPEQVQRCES